jgi:hypothetical protein
MKIQHLLEGTEPKLPGAPKGIQIMTPQQFVAKAGDMPGEEEVDEGYPKHQDLSGVSTDKLKAYLAKQSQQSVPGEGSQIKRVQAELQRRQQGVAEVSDATLTSYLTKLDRDNLKHKMDPTKRSDTKRMKSGPNFVKAFTKLDNRKQGVAEGSDDKEPFDYEKWKASTVKPRKPRGHKDAEALGKAIDSEQSELRKRKEQGVAEGYQFKGPFPFDVDHMHGGRGINLPSAPTKKFFTDKKQWERAVNDINSSKYDDNSDYIGVTGRSTVEINGHEWARWSDAQQKGYIELSSMSEQGVAEGSEASDDLVSILNSFDYYSDNSNVYVNDAGEKIARQGSNWKHQSGKTGRGAEELGSFLSSKQDVAEGLEHLNRIRKLSGLDEATKLPAQSREFGGDEFQDYMKRIVGTPDVDKAGNVKTDKKGNEKYVSGKTKSDRYKMPYIHRSSVVSYLSPDGKTYDEDAVKKTLAIRPKALLKQNEKMKHSNGEFEQFFNVGFAALTGIALDEQTNKLIIVNTCPGAGACKVDCFAMKGGKVQFQGPWQSDGRILTYLLNDPDGFFNQLSAEITKESVAGKKGDKKFPNGWQTTVRWHDAGDFFSPEYLDMALKMAAKHPDVKFYAYTKMAGAALAKKPDNFIINWSEGAHTSQEKQVKASDANLDTTKNSRIVPDEIFQDLLVKDEKKNLVKGEQGQWQVQPDKLPELKQRLAKEYGLSSNSILSYDEYMAKRKSIPQGMKYNVIVAPGEGDISANDQNIISTLLLRH